MKNILIEFCLAMVPIHQQPQRCVKAVDYFLKHLPRMIRPVFLTLVLVVAGLAFMFRRRQATHQQAMVVWVNVWLESNITILRLLGLWLKATACMIVLAEEQARKQLYAFQQTPLPSQVALPEFKLPAVKDITCDEADFIIIGSGPAGATVAKVLSENGHSVLMLEEGPHVPNNWQAESTIELLKERFRQAGMLTTFGGAPIPILQGRAVGGSSVINSAIVWRAPEDVFTLWHQDTILKQHLSVDRVQEGYAFVENVLSMRVTSEKIFGENAVLMKKATDHLKMNAAPIQRYVSEGCEGLGRCLEGCPKNNKFSMNVSFIPQAIKAGTVLYSDCSVEKIIFENTQATGVQAKFAGKKVVFRAKKAVIVAASAIQTPLLLKASGIQHALLGERLMAHPGYSMLGLFKHVVRGEKLGATQGYDSVHYRISDRFKLETLTLPDELVASRIYGVGEELINNLKTMPNMALWCSLIRARAQGSVRGSLRFPRVVYQMTKQDELTLGKSVMVLAEMLLAAGADEVLPGVFGLPKRATDPKALGHALQGVKAEQVSMIISHLFGTAVMGGEKAVCDPYGRVYNTKNVFVADSSLFPSNLGVNPQHTLMALAHHVAIGLLEQRQRKAA